MKTIFLNLYTEQPYQQRFRYSAGTPHLTPTLKIFVRFLKSTVTVRWAEDARERWADSCPGVMYQESSFKHDAQRLFIRFYPLGRVSSAYGYSQAKTMTWEDYQRETGNSWASRSSFEDAIDFMGWFIYKTYQVNGVSKWDAYGQYLNYHEGWGGYQRKTYLKKPWLVRVSRIVKRRSLTYATQLKTCEEDLQKGWLWRLFFG